MILNAVYQFINGNDRIRIIYIFEHENLCAYVPLEVELATPVLENISILEEEIANNNLVEIIDPYMQLIEEEFLSKAVKNKRDTTWEIIEKYWGTRKAEFINKSTRMGIFQQISQEGNIPLMTVRRMFSRFWQRGMTPNACLPDFKNRGTHGKEINFSVKTGRPKQYIEKDNLLGVNIDAKIKQQIEIAVNKYYRTKQRKSITAVYKAFLQDFYSVPIKEDGEIYRKLQKASNIPTYGQFYYWFKKNEDQSLDFKKRFSNKEYDLTQRPILSNSIIEAPGPGFRIQFDATPGDAYIVSELDRNKIIGRGMISGAIDVFSRLITGIYVGLEQNSWSGALMALDSVVADKSELCANYGISISNELWPSSGQLPEAIIADRGEMKGHGAENFIKNFGVHIETTSAYRGDLKGIIERLNRSINDRVKSDVPGAIMTDFRKRGDPDYRLEAKLTLKEFRKYILLAAIDHNLSVIEKYQLTPEMIRDNVRPVPLELWNWGLAKQKGSLKKVDRLTFRLGILPRGEATISRGAVIFKTLHYGASELLVEYSHMKNKEKEVDVIFDPQNLRNIYMVRPDGSGHILLNLLETSMPYANFSLEEISAMNKMAAASKKSADNDHAAFSSEIKQQMDKLIKNATKATNEQQDTSAPKSQRLKDIRKNRTEEKQRLNEEETLIPPPPSLETPGEIIPFIDKKEISGSETKPQNTKEDLIDMLRRRKHEHKKR